MVSWKAGSWHMGCWCMSAVMWDADPASRCTWSGHASSLKLWVWVKVVLKHGDLKLKVWVHRVLKHGNWQWSRGSQCGSSLWPVVTTRSQQQGKVPLSVGAEGKQLTVWVLGGVQWPSGSWCDCTPGLNCSPFQNGVSSLPKSLPACECPLW